MTLNRARELIQIQMQLGGGYNRNSVRLVLREVQNVHGQSAVDQLIREFDLDTRFDLKPGMDFSRV